MEPFSLSRAENRLYGVHFGDDVLRLRPSGWVQLGVGAQMVVAGAFLLLLRRLGGERQLIVGVAAALAVGLWGLLQWAGTLDARPNGMTLWWFGVRRIRWDRVDEIRVAQRAPWWASGWPRFEVVEVVRHGGRPVVLWPTRCGSSSGSFGSPAAVQCALLERYRRALASSP